MLEYLGRYTHRVAISNQRLTALADREVSFRWKDYRHHNRTRIMTLSAELFIERFLLHTLPPGFRRIRHYGWLANRHRRAKIALCRHLLGVAVSDLLPQPRGDFRQLYEQLTGVSLRRCPRCGGTLVLTHLLHPGWRFPVPVDTS